MQNKKIINQLETNSYQIFSSNFKILDTLDKGFYKVYEEKGLFSSSLEIRKDDSIKILNFEMQQKSLIDSIENFFNEKTREITNKIGFIHKIGVLLYGQAGTGKTTFIYQLANKFIQNKNCIVFTVKNIREFQFVLEFCKSLRKELVLKNPIIIIMDECESHMYNNENYMKDILDGHGSLDNCLMLFSTNYINDIPEAIKNRPSRIKYCIEFKPEDDELRAYKILKELNEKCDNIVKEEKLKSIVVKHKKSTVDEIKHAFLDLITK